MGEGVSRPGRDRLSAPAAKIQPTAAEPRDEESAAKLVVAGALSDPVVNEWGNRARTPLNHVRAA